MSKQITYLNHSKWRKTTANNTNCNVPYNLQVKMAERSKAPDSRKFRARDFLYTNVCVRSNPTPVRSF